MISDLYTGTVNIYGKKPHGYLLRKLFMKKIFSVAASLILVVVSANSQAEKKEPPPPPKPTKEVVKFEPPKIVADEEVNAAEPKDPPVVTIKGKVADDFYERNPSVSDISRQANIIRLKKKDGTIEKYDMNKKEENKSFTEKYGMSQISPTPPPPKKVS